MDCTLSTLHTTSKGIFSILQVGAYTFFVAEHAYPTTQDGWAAKLERGKTYTCQRWYSPHLGYYCFQIMNVPNHTSMLIHIGCFPQIDSDGCCLIGEGLSMNAPVPMITNSKKAFDAFMLLQVGVETFQLHVEAA